jgi:hypothetical protein
MLAALAVFAMALLALLIHYRYHVLRKLDSACADVQAVPISQMPESPPPTGWRRCEFASLQFALPPGMATGLRKQTQQQADGRKRNVNNNGVWLFFKDGPRSLYLSLCRHADRENVTELGPPIPPEGQGLSSLHLRLACYQADSRDFRWSMSPAQVRWHTWCITMRRLMPAKAEVEIVMRDNLEGLAEFAATDAKVAEFEWQTKDGNYGGTMIFADKAQPIDVQWVRAVCQSIAFCGEGCPKTLTQDEAPQLFQVLSP